MTVLRRRQTEKVSQRITEPLPVSAGLPCFQLDIGSRPPSLGTIEKAATRKYLKSRAPNYCNKARRAIASVAPMSTAKRMGLKYFRFADPGVNRSGSTRRMIAKTRKNEPIAISRRAKNQIENATNAGTTIGRFFLLGRPGILPMIAAPQPGGRGTGAPAEGRRKIARQIYASLHAFARCDLFRRGNRALPIRTASVDSLSLKESDR